MDKALDIGKSSATGSFHLLIGVAGSNIIMAIGTLFLAAVLNADQVGLYGLAFIPANIIGFFRDLGVNSALTKQIASCRGNNSESKLCDIVYAGVIFEILTGAILSLVCFAIAEPIAYILSPNNVAVLTVYISILSISIFAGALINAGSGIFIGFEKMRLNSFTQILQATVKTAVGPLLVILGFGVLGAMYGAILSFIAGAGVSMFLVYFVMYKPLRKRGIRSSNLKETLKPLLSYGLPLTASTIVTGVLPQVFAFTMALYAGTELMGNYYVSTYFAVLLTFISIPVTSALFPVFSKLDIKRDSKLIKQVFASSIKYTSLLLVPATLLIITLSAPLINTLFPSEGFFHSLFMTCATPKYAYAPIFLAFSSLINLLVLVGYITLATFQNGIAQTKQVMKQSLLSLLIGLFLAYFIVAYFYSIGSGVFAVVGGLLGSLFAFIPSLVWGLYWSWKNYGVKADFNLSAKILVASTLAAIATFFFTFLVKLPWCFTLVGGFFIFLVIYLVAAPLIGAINADDIESLQHITSNLGIISKVLNIPLKIMLKVYILKNNHTFFRAP